MTATLPATHSIPPQSSACEKCGLEISAASAHDAALPQSTCETHWPLPSAMAGNQLRNNLNTGPESTNTSSRNSYDWSIEDLPARDDHREPGVRNDGVAQDCTTYNQTHTYPFPPGMTNSNGHSIPTGHGIVGTGYDTCTYSGAAGSVCSVQCLDNWSAGDTFENNSTVTNPLLKHATGWNYVSGSAAANAGSSGPGSASCGATIAVSTVSCLIGSLFSTQQSQFQRLRMDLVPPLAFLHQTSSRLKITTPIPATPKPRRLRHRQVLLLPLPNASARCKHAIQPSARRRPAVRTITSTTSSAPVFMTKAIHLQSSSIRTAADFI